jgi:hypothetical protein
MAELVDAPHSKCGEAAPRGSSSLPLPINLKETHLLMRLFNYLHKGSVTVKVVPSPTLLPSSPHQKE